MANTVSNTGIKESWSLISFTKAHGKMQVGQFVHEDTGETWKSCIFTNPENGERTFVSFSRNLGELTPQEIKEQKDELQVVECETKEGNQMFSLCKAGQNAWQDVELF